MVDILNRKKAKANLKEIDFSLVISYTDNGHGQRYFYFLYSHGDVSCFSDANFTPEQTENYEYTPWGVLLTSASKNDLLYTAREFDFDALIYIQKGLPYSHILGNFTGKYNLPKSFYLYTIKNNPTNYIIMSYSYNASSDISCRWCYLVCVCCDVGDCRIVWCIVFIYIHCRF